jgi:hypothetical protein
MVKRKRNSLKEKSSVEFYREDEGDKKTFFARVGGRKKETLRDFLLSSRTDEEKKALVKALLQRMKKEGVNEDQIVNYIVSLFSEKDERAPDIMIRHHPDNPKKTTASFDEKEIEKAKQNPDLDIEDLLKENRKKNNALNKFILIESQKIKKLKSILTEAEEEGEDYQKDLESGGWYLSKKGDEYQIKGKATQKIYFSGSDKEEMIEKLKEMLGAL